MKSRNIALRHWIAIVSIFTLCGSSCLLAGRPLDRKTAGAADSLFEARKGGHAARLTLRTRPFQPSAHRIEQRDGGLRVDGRVALGSDGGIPRIEIERMALAFDGRIVAIPATLYRDVFEPRFEKGSFAVRFGDDLASLFVFMAGGDAAGSYQVIWVLRRDGKHSRFSLPCPDCRFVDFNGGVLGWTTENE